MALSLGQVTANNVSGTYTPSGLLNGYFDLNIVGDVTINFPTGLVGGGQIVGIRTTMADDSQPVISWGSAYKGGSAGLWQGSASEGVSWLSVFLCAGGEAYLISSDYAS